MRYSGRTGSIHPRRFISFANVENIIIMILQRIWETISFCFAEQEREK